MTPPNDDSQAPDDDETIPLSIDQSNDADETNAFPNPLEDTVVPGTPTTDSDPEKTGL